MPGSPIGSPTARPRPPKGAVAKFHAPKGACPPTTPFGGGLLVSALRSEPTNQPTTMRRYLNYSCGIGGAAPVNPCPRSARGGAVFFIVVGRW